MESFEPFVTVNVDVTLLSKAFKNIVERLSILEKKMGEQEIIITQKADVSEINDLKTKMTQFFNDTIQSNQENSEKMEKFEKGLQDKFSQIDNSLEKACKEATEEIAAQLKANGDIPSDVMEEISECFIKKEIISLKLTRQKGE